MAATLRNSNVKKLGEHPFDVLIVGGGINGAVAAASLAGRGVRVALRRNPGAARQARLCRHWSEQAAS